MSLFRSGVSWLVAMVGLATVACASTAKISGSGAPAQTDDADDVYGRCELVVPGRDAGPAPCDGITLFLRHRRSGETRRAEFRGFEFRFRDLDQRSYVLSAASPGYDVETNIRDEVTPGQRIELRVRATPHP